MKMKCSVKLLGVLAGMVALIPTSLVGDTHSEQDRLQNAGRVMKEVLNIPDDIPTDLLNKARCVVVMPSVLKAAFIVGGSYGRGAMVCRTGKNFKGPWRSEEHTSELQSQFHLVCRLLLEKKKHMYN